MISIVIPAYNRAKTLPRTLESVLAQTYRDFEVIVVDDCSTDRTIDAVKKFSDSRIRYERLTQNSGVHVARNRGLELSRGEFVIFFDSDDELFQYALERMHKIFTNKDFGIVTAPYRLSDGSLTSFDRPEGEVPFEEYMCNRTMRSNKASLIMYRREAIGELRWFERNLDFVFCRRVAARARQYYIAEPLAAYHTQKGGASQSMTAARRIPNKALSISRAKIIADYADDFAPLLTKNCPQLYGYYAYGAAVGLLLGGEVKKARRLARAAAFNQPRPKYFLLYAFSIIPGASALMGAMFSLKGVWIKVRELFHL